MNKISVIIPAYNAQNTIKQTIEAILTQVGLSEKPEIIVVDDGSNDNTIKILNKYSDIKIISQKNKGPASARNRGALLSTGQILVFTDSDTIPHKNWLFELTNPFTTEKIQASTGTYGIANSQNKLANLIQQEIAEKHNHYSQYVNFGGTYNFAISRKLFFKIGGFNEEYLKASGEDTELSYRIISNGFKIRFVPTAIVDHFHPENLQKYLTTQFIHGYWRAKVYYQHPKRLKGDSYTGIKEIFETASTGSVLAFFILFIISLIFKIPKKYKRIPFISILIVSMTIFYIEYLTLYKIFKNSNQSNLPSKNVAILIFSARAFIRTCGFIIGFISFYILK